MTRLYSSPVRQNRQNRQNREALNSKQLVLERIKTKFRESSSFFSIYRALQTLLSGEQKCASTCLLPKKYFGGEQALHLGGRPSPTLRAPWVLFRVERSQSGLNVALPV